MKMRCKPIVALIVAFIFATANAFSQSTPADSLIGPIPPIDPNKWGPNDTIITGAIYYINEWMPYKEMEMVWVSKMNERQLAKYIEEWTRLRNAVYVTYPYARTAGRLMNDINAQMSQMKNKKERKAYIK